MNIPVEVSARHVHLSQQDFVALFGSGELTVKRYLSQPGQYLSNERVNVVGPKGSFANVAVLGPFRAQTQAEVSLTDCRVLGAQAPVRESGKLEGSAPFTLEGPAGSVALPFGLIAAMRHVHMTPENAAKFGVTDGQIIAVRLPGPRALVFENVVARVSPNFALYMHIDTDEANAAGVGIDGAEGTLCGL